MLKVIAMTAEHANGPPRCWRPDMTQEEFDRELEKHISSPIPTLIVLGGIAVFVLVGWLLL